MTQQLEQVWLGKVLTPAELKQYAEFLDDYKSRTTIEQQQEFSGKWNNIEAQVLRNYAQDPRSGVGLRIAEEAMTLINNHYGEEHANLKHAIWEAYKAGKVECEDALDPKVVRWLNEAFDQYYRNRIYAFLDRVELHPDPGSEPKFTMEWNALLREMHGGHRKADLEVRDEALLDKRIGPVAKHWIRQYFASLT